MANRLAREKSPYLLQHANNPVDWYPWGEEALRRAREEDKPIFLSIGYAACHWCHVMERESFENAEVAEVLNRHFVSIKVDREERPDLDDVYMAATVALSGSGGWPMSVFLAPDQRPFFAGTYFPPTDRYGRPGFMTILKRIADLWNNERTALLEQAERLTEHVRDQSEPAMPLPIPPSAIDDAVEALARSYDARHGGFGDAPKFPPHQALALLLRHHVRTGDPRSLEMVRGTLDGMKNGGIYDHVGGGFARYSTDERWLVPHFEKMLYDNAQLAAVYLEAFQVTADTEYERVARETLDYVVREMQGAEGGYFSATDADSEGEEGKFFVFAPDEIEEILGREEAEVFCLYYDITPAGNWEGKNVLHTPRPLARVAAELGLEPSRLAERLARSRAAVYAARSQRVPPLLDDKVLTAWNGLMIGAMAEGYRVLRDPRYLESAERAARFVRERLRDSDGGLLRTARGGRAAIPGFLEDYAYFADGLVTLYEAGGDETWLALALELAERIVRDFGEPDGGFYATSEAHERLITRLREGHDGALPAANAVAARALVRLSKHFERPDLEARAASALNAYGQLVARAPRAFPSTLMVLDFLLAGPVELALVGPPGRADTEALATTIARHFLPSRILAPVDPSRPGERPPLARGKELVNGSAAVYICRNFACERPITSADELDRALGGSPRPNAPA
ncbi:MAG TPA: thioredoxin domain-containing protein [Polyangiaceae bacterium]|nr:thioredoxin domain-containing protein [Polyangiaceae bacterium]